MIWWGEICIDLLLTGSIDALVVSFIVTIILLSIFKYIKDIAFKTPTTADHGTVGGGTTQISWANIKGVANELPSVKKVGLVK